MSAGGGSLLKSFTNPSSINGFLTNTQKVLNTAQQVGPIGSTIRTHCKKSSSHVEAIPWI